MCSQVDKFYSISMCHADTNLTLLAVLHPSAHPTLTRKAVDAITDTCCS